MSRNGKIAVILGGSIALVVICVAAIGFSVYSNTKADLARQISAMPLFDDAAVYAAEAAKLNFKVPIAMPAVAASDLLADISKQAKARAERQYSSDRMDRQVVADIAKIAVAKKGDRVTFKRKDGSVVSGKLKSVTPNAAEVALITVDTLNLKLLSDVDPKDHFRFSAPIALRERMRIKAEQRRKYENDKTAMYNNIAQLMREQKMYDAGYCFDGTDWVSAAQKVRQETMLREAAFQLQRDKDIQKLLDGNTVFGIRFSPEQLGVKL